MKQYQLPKEFATKWVEELRSNKYGQTSKQLWDGDNSYCCLGVACRVIGASDETIIFFNKSSIAYDGCVASRNLGGIPEGLTPELHSRLTGLNDSERKSFPEIADWIEQNVDFL